MEAPAIVTASQSPVPVTVSYHDHWAGNQGFFQSDNDNDANMQHQSPMGAHESPFIHTDAPWLCSNRPEEPRINISHQPKRSTGGSPGSVAHQSPGSHHSSARLSPGMQASGNEIGNDQMVMRNSHHESPESMHTITRASVIGYGSSDPKDQSSEDLLKQSTDHIFAGHNRSGASPSDFASLTALEEQYQSAIQNSHLAAQDLQSFYNPQLSGLTTIPTAGAPGLDQQQFQVLQQQNLIDPQQYFNSAILAAYDPNTAGYYYTPDPKTLTQYGYPATGGSQYAGNNGPGYCPPTPPFNSPPQYAGMPQPSYSYDAQKLQQSNGGRYGESGAFSSYGASGNYPTSGHLDHQSSGEFGGSLVAGGSQGTQQECARCGGLEMNWIKDAATGQFLCQNCYAQSIQPKVSTQASVSSNGSSKGNVSKAKKAATTNQRRQGLVCANCSTTQTTLWRRNNEGEPVCNACGLYYKLHGIQRPMAMKKDGIQTRKRKPKNPNGLGGKSKSKSHSSHHSHLSLEDSLSSLSETRTIKANPFVIQGPLPPVSFGQSSLDHQMNQQTHSSTAQQSAGFAPFPVEFHPDHQNHSSSHVTTLAPMSIPSSSPNGDLAGLSTKWPGSYPPGAAILPVVGPGGPTPEPSPREVGFGISFPGQHNSYQQQQPKKEGRMSNSEDYNSTLIDPQALNSLGMRRGAAVTVAGDLPTNLLEDSEIKKDEDAKMDFPEDPQHQSPHPSGIQTSIICSKTEISDAE